MQEPLQVKHWQYEHLKQQAKNQKPHKIPKIIALPLNHFNPCSSKRSAIFMVMPYKAARIKIIGNENKSAILLSK